MTSTSHLFDIALLEETRLARIMTDIADEAQPFDAPGGPGMALRGPRGTWLNYATGMGLHGPVPRERIEWLVDWHSSHGCEPRIDAAPFADAQLFKDAADLGFDLRSFTSILYRELSKTDRFTPRYAPEGLEIRAIDRNDAKQTREFTVTATSGFFPPDKPPPEMFIELAERAAKHPKVTALVAYLDGKPVGAGAVEIHPGLRDVGTSVLIGLSVHPDYRRRGIQQALICERLNVAAKSGVKYVTIGSVPGGPTERNALRYGFALAYTKVTLAKKGEGLVSSRD